MAEMIFQFNPYLYRVCNQRTWDLLTAFDGERCEVECLPMTGRAAYALDDRWSGGYTFMPADAPDVLVQVVTFAQPDGSKVTLIVFNSELHKPYEGPSGSDEPTKKGE